MTPGDDGITFEVDRLIAGPTGRIEVSGRWHGVRGRRFVRPTLTLTLKGDESEHRVLADLEHKPWAAQDGDTWLAAFAFDGDLEAAERIELAVAPDITVELAGGSGPRVNTGRAADLIPAGSTRSPVVRDDPARPRPRAPQSPEIVRLRERLALAESVVTRERTRRQAAEQGVEDERQSARTLQAEVGRLRAELELAGAVQRELDTASAGLDDLRSQTRELGRERDRIAAQRDDAQRELAQARAEMQRLASQLADAEAAVRRLTQAGREARRSEAQPRATPLPGVSRTAAAASESRGAGRGARDATASRADAASAENGETGGQTERMPLPLGGDGPQGVEARGAPAQSGHDHAPERTRGDAADRSPSPLPRTDRPLNPSLRGSNWLGRGIALIVFVIVVVAVIVVINSTIT